MFWKEMEERKIEMIVYYGEMKWNVLTERRNELNTYNSIFLRLLWWFHSQIRLIILFNFANGNGNFRFHNYSIFVREKFILDESLNLNHYFMNLPYNLGISYVNIVVIMITNLKYQTGSCTYNYRELSFFSLAY